MQRVIRRVIVMEKKSISDYKELYSTFMRLKDVKPQQEYTVVPAGKDKVNKNGTNASR